MPCYFFFGKQYIRVTRPESGAGEVDLGYPEPISNWGWGSFGANGIDAALDSGSVDYFFSGKEYIRVTRGTTGPGKMDPGYPAPISNWGWGSFGANGINAALSSGTKDFFFSGKEYIRVTRSDTGPGKMDPGYPAPISNWGWGAFGANGIDAAFTSGSKAYFFSGSKYIRMTRTDDTGPGTMDPGYPAPISTWGWGMFGALGINAALFSGIDKPVGNVVSVPGPGLGSNSNYFLYSGCKPLTDLTVTINVNEDLVTHSSSGSTKGFSFQLNAYSPQNEKSAWQQYVIALFGTDLIGAIDNWPKTGDSLILTELDLMSFTKPYIPAGYQLKIQLQTGASQNVVGVIFTVIFNGLVLAKVTKTLTDISGVTSADLAPIVAFQMNLVGPVSSESTVLSSGAGTMIYEASSPLTVLSSEPGCAESGYVTAETANSVYGTLTSGPMTGFAQTFGITAAEHMIRKTGKFRPSFVRPTGGR